jgi:hypothetical protein
MIPRLEAGSPSAVGSLPHTDVEAAAVLALALQPELPTAPQLPSRHPLEGMLAQASAGMPGVEVCDGSLVVDRRKLAAVDEGCPLDRQAWAGTIGFLRHAAAAAHAGPVKVQIAGPITLGMALLAGGAKPSRAFAIAADNVRSRVNALVAEAAATLPDAGLVIVLDEPALTAYVHPDFPLGPDETIDLLSGGLASAGSAAMMGVHCCGPTDWRLVLHSGPDLISLPVDASIGDDASGLSNFLDRGGWIAWGAVATDQPLGDRDEPHWRHLTELWCDLARSGCDPMLLRSQSIITPACGLARHRVAQVPGIYALVRRIAERVQDQALAARMSAGA